MTADKLRPRNMRRLPKQWKHWMRSMKLKRSGYSASSQRRWGDYYFHDSKFRYMKGIDGISIALHKNFDRWAADRICQVVVMPKTFKEFKHAIEELRHHATKRGY